MCMSATVRTCGGNMKKSIIRIFAAILASVSVFAFAACDTEGGHGDGTDVGNGGVIGGTDKDDGNDNQNNGGTVKPPEPVIPTVPAGSVKITEAAGDLEAAYVIWDKVDGAMSYNVYCKADGGEYVKLDAPLVREYKDYCRADAVGLKAGKYEFKVVPTGGAEYTEDEGKAATATEISVLAHERAGYAFVNGTSAGAYNEDGTLKAGANVLYITENTKDTVSVNVAGANANPCVGLQAILDGYAKGKETKPLAVRLIGNITDLKYMLAGDLVVSNKNNSALGITVEGIGNDATANGWGLRVKDGSNVEIRNIGFMNCNSDEGDNVGLQQGNDHVWVHNCDMFYGDAGSDADQVKGDGALDTKKSSYITHSYNHFWDSGKCNLQGNTDESYDNKITYHHNWYDHSDSRHPRIRMATVHIYNNYFDGNAKYGVGVTQGASAFAENNYFRSTATMKPLLSAKQGTDLKFIDKSNPKGIFSSDPGGMIKSYGNIFDCPSDKLELITQNETDDKTNLDCYLASSRSEKVPGEYTTKSENRAYSNFDTASDFYKYEVDTPEKAKEKVELYAGRIGGGDLKWEFDDNTEDGNYAVIPALKSALMAYKQDLVKVGIDAINVGGSSGGNQGGESGGMLPDNVNKIEFISENDGKYPAGITVNGNYDSKTGYLKMESSTSVTVKVEKETTITVHTNGASAKRIKLNGTNTTLDGNGECSITIAAGGTLTIEKGDQMQLMYILLS